MKIAIISLLAASLAYGQQSPPPSVASRVAGVYVAYNYGLWNTFPTQISAATGSQTFTVRDAFVTLPDGRTIVPWSTNAPITVGRETVTPSAVSGCSVGETRPNVCQITATFSQSHTRQDSVTSASFGLQEALNDAAIVGGTVVIDGAWAAAGGTTGIKNAATVPGNTAINDCRTSCVPGTGSGTVTGQATGVIPLPTGANVIGAQSHLDDGVTNAGQITSTEPVTLPAAANTATGLQAPTANAAVTTKSAAAYGNGTTTGIASAAANNATVEAGYTYPITEVPGPYSFSSSPFHFHDLRVGQETNFYHNPSQLNFFNWGIYNYAGYQGDSRYCMFDKLYTWTAGTNIALGCMAIGIVNQSPGWSIGNPSGFSGAAGSGWQIDKGLSFPMQFNGSGISNGIGMFMTKAGIGDQFAQYNYLNGHGGYTAASDQGGAGFATNTSEDTTLFSGLCATGCTTGSTQVKLTIATGPGTQGTGRFVYDRSQAPITGHITNVTSSFFATIDTTIAAPTAYGNTTAAINAPINNTAPGFATSETFNVTVTTGTFTTSTLLCFSGTAGHECTKPTAVGALSGGVQSITAPIRVPHQNGAGVFQGGMAGYGLIVGETPANGQAYLWDVFGSTDANTIVVGRMVQGNLTAFPNLNQTATFTSLSSSGSTVTATYTGGLGGNAWIYSGVSFWFSGASDAAFNNVACTNSVWTTTTPPGNNNGTLTCTVAGIGTHSAASATGMVGTSTQPGNYVQLVPMAEVIDVQNESASPPTLDGSLTPEPNVIAFAPGDTIAEPNHISALYYAMNPNLIANNPYCTRCTLIGGTGVGNAMTGGGDSAANNSLALITNGQPDSYYVGTGGPNSAPNFFNVSGSYHHGFLFNHYPEMGRDLFLLNPSAAQTANPNFFFNLFQLGASYQMKFIPSTGMMITNGNSAFSSIYSNAGGVLRGPLVFGGITASFLTLPVWLQNSWTSATPVCTSGTVGGITACAGTSTQTIANGTAVMTTAAIVAGCGTTVTVVAAGVAATDSIAWSFNAAPSGSNAGLVSWPTAGNVNFAYCGIAETPAAATINWSVTR